MSRNFNRKREGYGTNWNQWYGPQALNTEIGSLRGHDGVSVSRGKVVGADVVLLLLLGYQGW